MVAMVLIGVTNLLWMIALTALVLIYKLAPASTLRWASATSGAVVALGILYTALA
jgi:predicted metal-binding membrane protein